MRVRIALALVIALQLPSSGTANASGVGLPDAGVCVGVRGNGPRLWAHFTSLARITEEFGLLRGAAGGSSGSLTLFLIESVRANPLVEDCGQRRCSRRERAAREAVLFKAIQGVQQAGLTNDIVTVVSVIQAVQEADIEALLADPSTAPEGIQSLIDILTDPAVQSIINPELFTLLQQSPDPVFHAQDIIDGLANAASFSVDDPNVFVRPGIINFAALAEVVGRLGNFLAGYGPLDRAGMRDFLEACGTPGRGLDWPDVAALAAPGGTCGETFSGLFDDFLAASQPGDPSRLDDPIGRYVPSLVATSVLQGAAVPAFEAAKASYFAAQPITELGVEFADVRFGYWGNRLDLRRVARGLPRLFDDAKSARFTPISESPWREILQYSPAEPGLSRALELPDGRVSAGGWTDPVPTQVLRALARCPRVVLVNRKDGIGSFTTGVAAQLGATQQDLDDLFDLADPTSGFSTALRRASGVWCTDWDAPDQFDIRGLSAEGWNPPLETRDRRLLRYPNAGTELGIAGCTPGVPF